ncbi:hypothetical protein [Pandoraea pnomenusa]|uniref:hypothetical protein n=1 Tax=Pandoraea pnomenusa TaxID=93220 RepID=UPI0012DA1120|nr:hypothetical protein [Pandoraea pnomenusa]
MKIEVGRPAPQPRQLIDPFTTAMLDACRAQDKVPATRKRVGSGIEFATNISSLRAGAAPKALIAPPPDWRVVIQHRYFEPRRPNTG